ncbi:MAG: hypothetical protein ABR586_10245 [Thermoplasmatota archaeon]
MGSFLTYSKGHAVLLAHDSAPMTLNQSGANENLFAALNDTQEITGIMAAAGQQIILETAYASSPEAVPPPITGSLNVTAEGGLRLNRTVPFWFRCGANLEPFRGDFAAQGFNPSLVVVADAASEYEAPTTVLAEFVLYGDPRFASTCSASITSEGRPLAASGTQSGLCSVHAVAPPGRVGFRIQDTALSGPLISYSVQGLPSGLIPPHTAQD